MHCSKPITVVAVKSTPCVPKLGSGGRGLSLPYITDSTSCMCSVMHDAHIPVYVHGRASAYEYGSRRAAADGMPPS